MTDEELDLIEIKRGLSLLFQPRDIVEIRVPRKHDIKFSSTISGFFDDLDKLAQAIQYINTKYNQTVYMTMNPIKKSWMTVDNTAYIGSKSMREALEKANQPLEPRMKKSMIWETGKEHWSMRMTDDSDILERRWILVDIDAGQPSGTNSNDIEHQYTHLMTKAVLTRLKEHGFPGCGVTNSGNGHHIYIRVLLENSAASTVLVRRFLRTLAQEFNGKFGNATIDEAMFNAGRITKATGTKVFKGPHTITRPCRKSTVLQFANNQTAPIELIQKIANEYVLKPNDVLAYNPNDQTVVDSAELQKQISRLQEFLDFYELDYTRVIQDGGTYRIPCTCPNEEEHTMNGGEMETFVTVHANGALGFCCHHGHCQRFRGWKEFKKFLQQKYNKTFKWEPEGILFFKGKQITGPPVPYVQKSIWINPAPTKLNGAIALLSQADDMTPTHEVMAAGAELGLSERTVRRAYSTAGVTTIQTKAGYFLKRTEPNL